MKFTININLDNAAFDPDVRPELARILGVVSEQVEHKRHDKSEEGRIIRDINGNRVGSWIVTPEN